MFSALVATAEESAQHSCFVMGPLTQLFAHQLKQLRKFIDVHDQITYPFPLKAGNNSSSETQRGRYLLGGEGKSKRAGKWPEYFSMRHFFHPFRLSLAPKSVACVAWRFWLGALK